MRKRILVTGSARYWETDASRRAWRLGAEIAANDFALTTGAEPGVDKAASEGYCTTARRRGLDLRERFTQLKTPFRLRSWLNVSSGYDARDARRMVSESEWLQVAVDTCDAALMIGGRMGAFRIAEHFLDAGKPVFPVPFAPGRSGDVFQDILRHWSDRPVPGLTRNQFLRLSLPWTGGTDPLMDLLRGALADIAEIFISYRRTDAGWAAGRLQAELADYFGDKRVFTDVTHLKGGQVWKTQIAHVIQHARVGIVVVGRNWLGVDSGAGLPRLLDESDIVRMEVRSLLNTKAAVIVVLADAPALIEGDLPPDLAPLASVHALTISHDRWQAGFANILAAVRSALADSQESLGPNE